MSYHLKREGCDLMNCCINCFEDFYIIDKIKNAGIISECNYCGENGVPTIGIEMLIDDFENLLSIYETTTLGEHYNHHIHCPTNHGDLLEELIQEDWQIFSDKTNYGELLFDILNFNRGYEDALDSSELYSRESSAFSYISSSYIWNEFTYSIKRKSRYFPEINLSNDLKMLLPNKNVKFELNSPIFRARIGEFSKGEMGPPPFDKATSGRVNPRGIPYLYVASDTYTCIAETRPWIGAKVTVATIHAKETLNIIDLSSKEFLSSPFLTANLSQTIQAQELLNQLSYELSKPINPSDSDIEYIPTQYLAELIRNLGYDGLKYKSSLGSGMNYVFFSPEKFEYITIEVCEISAVGYDYQFRKN
jgi:hypothetical protein